MKILVADDEQLECDAIAYLVEKGNYGLTVLKAKNGREAVSVARKEQPEILFLDIQMPGIDGLEAARQIRSFLPDAQIVFLTAWGTFSFAQEAIRVKAADYLVKPANAGTFYAVLDKCIARIKEQPKEAMRQVASLFSREFFASLKYGDLPEETVRSYLESQGISSDKGIAVVLNKVETSLLSRLFAIFSYCFFPSLDRITVLAFAPKSALFDGFFEKEKALLQEKNVRLGIGLPFSSLDGIPQSIHGASLAYGAAMEQGLTLLRYHAALEERARQVPWMSKVGRLRTLVLEGKGEEARQLGHQIVDGLIASGGMKAGDVLYEFLLVFWAGVRSGLPRYLKEKPTKGSVREGEDWLMDAIDEATEDVRIDRQDKYRRTFDYVADFINTHYGEPLTADGMAGRVGVSQRYFPTLFKQYLGTSFIRYLTDVRLHEAKRLLREGESVKSAAGKVGYSDVNYFSRVFRGREGSSPEQYKREHVEEPSGQICKERTDSEKNPTSPPPESSGY